MALSEVFYIALIGTASGLLLKLASMLFKSKCSECQVCCFKIRRDTALEEREHVFDVLNNVKGSSKEEEKV